MAKTKTAAPSRKPSSDVTSKPAETPPERAAEPIATPRYTWAEIRAKVKAPADRELAVYAVRATPKALVEEGRKLRTERILTDLRLWIGQLVDWWSGLTPKQKTAIVGFSEARLRVVTHHAFKLLDLLERFDAGAEARIDHAASVARSEAAYDRAQNVRQLLRATLDQAGDADEGFAASVETADTAASDATALHTTLSKLVKLTRDTLAKGGDVADVLREDGLSDEALAQYDDVLKALKDTHESTRGSAAQGPVTQSQLDQQDGVCLGYMRRLRSVTRELRKVDPGVPVLIPRATARYFGLGRKPKEDDAAPSQDDSANHD